MYVQHRMAENGALLARLIMREGAFVYVCGDGVRMADDVNGALLGILQVSGGGRYLLRRTGGRVALLLCALSWTRGCHCSGGQLCV